MVSASPVITAAGVVVLFFLIGPLRDYLEPVFMTPNLAAEVAQ